MYPVVFPGLVYAATCGSCREDFVCGNGAGGRKLHDQGSAIAHKI